MSVCDLRSICNLAPIFASFAVFAEQGFAYILDAYFSCMEFDAKALEYLNNPHLNVFLTGKAGTGKSTLIRHWLKTSAPENTIVTAPTGIAALNVDGITLHKLIHARGDATVEDAKAKGRQFRSDPLYRALEVLVIDEISMVRADLMDSVDVFLQSARGNKKPFGGVKVVMVGDLAQLPPVVTPLEKKIFTEVYDGPWFFHSGVVKELIRKEQLAFVNLEHVYRQEDPQLVNILNDLRHDGGSIQALHAINAHVGNPTDKHTIILAATNKTADAINNQRLHAIQAPEQTYTATIKGQWNKTLEPAPKVVTLREGARVMMTTNDPAGLYANGSMGTVTMVAPDYIEVQLDSGPLVEVGYYTWQITVKQVVRDEHGVSHIISQPVGSYRQIPVVLGWAITIHKSQGKTFDALHVQLPNYNLFATGQAYVAFSRASSFDHLTLNRPLRAEDVMVDERVDAFMRLAERWRPHIQEALF